MITMRESVSTTKRSLQRRMGTFKRFGADKNRSSKTLKSDLIEYNLSYERERARDSLASYHHHLRLRSVDPSTRGEHHHPLLTLCPPALGQLVVSGHAT
jgi:hypothetical protein